MNDKTDYKIWWHEEWYLGLFWVISDWNDKSFEKLSLLLWIFKYLNSGKRAFSSFMTSDIHQDSPIG
jgi:hypothetical protein